MQRVLTKKYRNERAWSQSHSRQYLILVFAPSRELKMQAISLWQKIKRLPPLLESMQVLLILILILIFDQ